jgi:hypothetical protein
MFENTEGVSSNTRVYADAPLLLSYARLEGSLKYYRSGDIVLTVFQRGQYRHAGIRVPTNGHKLLETQVPKKGNPEVKRMLILTLLERI